METRRSRRLHHTLAAWCFRCRKRSSYPRALHLPRLVPARSPRYRYGSVSTEEVGRPRNLEPQSPIGPCRWGFFGRGDGSPAVHDGLVTEVEKGDRARRRASGWRWTGEGSGSDLVFRFLPRRIPPPRIVRRLPNHVVATRSSPGKTKNELCPLTPTTVLAPSRKEAEGRQPRTAVLALRRKAAMNCRTPKARFVQQCGRGGGGVFGQGGGW